VNTKREYWLDKPGNVQKVVFSVYALCGVLLLSGAFLAKQPHFAFEDWFGFYGFFGFVACVALVLAAKAMRLVLGRDKDYYDR
jgi:hypothetical protein